MFRFFSGFNNHLGSSCNSPQLVQDSRGITNSNDQNTTCYFDSAGNKAKRKMTMCHWKLGEIWRFKIRNLLYNPRRIVVRKPCPDQIFSRSTKDRSLKCLHFICPQQRGQISHYGEGFRRDQPIEYTSARSVLGVDLIREGRKGSAFSVHFDALQWFLLFYGFPCLCVIAKTAYIFTGKGKIKCHFSCKFDCYKGICGNWAGMTVVSLSSLLRQSSEILSQWMLV